MSQNKASAAAKLHIPRDDSNKAEQIRQDRLDISDANCTLEVDGYRAQVINYSTFGLAVRLDGDLKGKRAFERCTLRAGEFVVSVLDLKTVREESADLGARKIAFEITSEPLRIEQLQIIPEIVQMVKSALVAQQQLEKIPAPLMAIVFQIKGTLERLEKQINEFGQNQSFHSQRQLMEFEATVAETAARSLLKPVLDSFASVRKCLDGQGPELVKATFHFFRQELQELLYQSPFMTRNLQKPLGYSGDFEVMNLMYRNENQGASLYHKCIERFFLLQPEPIAVRNRVGYLQKKIIETLVNSKKKTVRIMSVASGPAIEIQQLVERLDQEQLSRLEVHLLDQDQLSLKHAQRQIQHVLRSQKKSLKLVLQHRTIKSVIAQGLGEPKFELIYSAGLFDYFTDQVARMAAGILVNSLEKEANLVIGNFDIATPNAFAMSLLWEWNLIYRSKEDLQKIFDFEIASTLIESEERGINLFAVIKRT